MTTKEVILYGSRLRFSSKLKLCVDMSKLCSMISLWVLKMTWREHMIGIKYMIILTTEAQKKWD